MTIKFRSPCGVHTSNKDASISVDFGIWFCEIKIFGDFPEKKIYNMNYGLTLYIKNFMSYFIGVATNTGDI